MSSRDRETLKPKREDGRQRVADLIAAAAIVIQERGLDAATMAEIAARAEANIGSLYRFFPNKEAVADALVEHHVGVLQRECAAIASRAETMAVDALADALIELLVRLAPQTRALTALLDAGSDRRMIRRRLAEACLAGIRASLTAHSPHLGAGEADDIAVIVLGNMKALVGMTVTDAPASPGAPAELVSMNRLYLRSKLAPPAARSDSAD